MKFAITKGRDIALALQLLLADVHRQGDIDGNDEFQVYGRLGSRLRDREGPRRQDRSKRGDKPTRRSPCAARE